MSWACLDDGFGEHPKIVDLDDATFRLHVLAFCTSARRGTDGRLDRRDLAAMMARVHGAPSTKALENAGLWEPVDGGWLIHDWLKYNKPAAKVKAEREAAKARVKAWREKRAERRDEGDESEGNGVRNGACNALRNDVRTPSLSHPIPSYPMVREEKLGEDQVALQKQRRHVDLAGGSSPARQAEGTGATNQPESPRTPAPVQGSRPAQQVALLPDEPKRNAPARQTRASKPETLIKATWDAFAAAHQLRHGVAPVWAGKMAGIFKRIVGEVGAEAPAVAAYYLTHNGSFYVSCGHSAAILERDVQKLRREMLTGNQVNAAAARHQEQRAATVDKWDERIREREREEQEGAIDVDCEPA